MSTENSFANMTANQIVNSSLPSPLFSYDVKRKQAAQYLADTNRGFSVYRSQYSSGTTLWELGTETFFVKFDENQVPYVSK